MTARDRMVLLVVAMLAIFAGFWFAVLSPKREEATELSGKVAAAQEKLDAARALASTAQAARARYASDYATVARLGKAVPVQDDVPTLVYQLESTAHDNDIDFRAIKVEASANAAPAAATTSAAVASANGSSATPAAATAAAASALPPGATVGPAGFPVMPFSFSFDGGFFSMQKFLKALDRYTQVGEGGKIDVRGRLLTINGVALKAGREGFPKVRASVSATAYLLPADQGLTAGATASAPGTATPASATGTSSPAPTTSAIVSSPAGGSR